MTKVRAQDTPSIDAETFWEIVNVGIRAGQATDPAVGTEVAGQAENPYYRAGNAIRELLTGEDPLLFDAGMSRFTALMDLYGRNVLDTWLRPSGQGAKAHAKTHDIHPAIIDVAARVRLSANGRFAQRKFLDEVESHAAKWYTDYDEWRQSSHSQERQQEQQPDT